MRSSSTCLRRRQLLACILAVCLLGLEGCLCHGDVALQALHLPLQLLAGRGHGALQERRRAAQGSLHATLASPQLTVQLSCPRPHLLMLGAKLAMRRLPPRAERTPSAAAALPMRCPSLERSGLDRHLLPAGRSINESWHMTRALQRVQPRSFNFVLRHVWVVPNSTDAYIHHQAKTHLRSSRSVAERSLQTPLQLCLLAQQVLGVPHS